MALRWSWSFGNESTADLTAMGWTAAGSPTLTSDADKVYSYTGSPTRYGWIFDGAFGSWTLPASVGASVTNGWLSAPIKSAVASGFNGDPILRAVGASSGAVIDARVTGSGALSLYVNNTFKETTAAIDWLSWRYVALRFDFSADPWTGQIWIDGTAATSLATQTRAPDTVGDLTIKGPGRFGTLDGYISQVVLWDSVSDSGQTPYFVTRVEPTSDGTNIGTWTPSTGVDDFAVVDSPFDAATYTEEASPSALDRVEVVTSSLGTATGVTPASVQGVTAHGFSEGQAITARTVLGDGGATEANGGTVAISASATTYTYATSVNAPSDASAWEATDTLDLIYEVVTV